MNRSQSRGKDSNIPRYACSRDPKNCRGSEDGCRKAHRRLTDAEKLKRDKWEHAKFDAGQSLGYERASKQANATAANVSSTGSNGCSRAISADSDRRKKDVEKNKSGGKGKDMVCRSYRETGRCSRGKECWFAKTIPGHPVT
eukprot:84205-Pyramimonas_sp.AAC.1